MHRAAFSCRFSSAKRLAEHLDGLVLLVLRGAEHEAVLWNGPVAELVVS